MSALHLIGIVGLTMAVVTEGYKFPSFMKGSRFDLKYNQYTSGNIVGGAGYSGDAQQVTSQKCFNTIVLSTSEQDNMTKLSHPILFSELEVKLGLYVNTSGKYEEFNIEPETSYIKSLEDNDYTMTLNYYRYATNNMSVQIQGRGVKALTESGKQFYNNGTNRFFGLICGDYYIASYQQGALFIIGLNIKFSSSIEKEKFIKHTHCCFKNILNAINSIKDIATRHHITGSLEIKAFQIGGNVTQLSEILVKDSLSPDYALTCELQSMDHCVNSAIDLMDYATNTFITQFSLQNNTGLVPLGIGFSQYRPIKEIGLISQKSLVTQEVIQNRNDLSNTLKENEYYQQKLYPFFNSGYPVKLCSAFYSKAEVILSAVDDNILRLMQPHGGAIDCFNVPYECKSTKASIYSQLKNITISDLTFLNDIKYTVSVPNGTLYSTGGGYLSWDGISDDPNLIYKVFEVNITDKQCSYCINVQVKNSPKKIFEMCFQGNSTSSGMEYEGTICYMFPKERKCNPAKSRKLLSPFFFEVYNNMDHL